MEAYVQLNGVTVACVLAKQVEMRFGVHFTTQWITVILKSKGIPRTTRSNRKPKEAYKQDTSANGIVLKDHAGLPLFEALFMNGAGKIIADTILRRNSMEFIKSIALILASGDFNRLSNYESDTINCVDTEGKGLYQAVMKVAEQPNILNCMNENLLDYWLSQGINIDRLYADGHTKIFYTRNNSLCGKISSSDKVAPGTKQVIVCQEDGFILWVEYHRVDEHLGEPFIKDGLKVMGRLGSLEEKIPLIVDREGSSKSFSEKALAEGVELLTLLRANSYKGLEDFVGDINLKGLYRWASEKKQSDARYFILHLDKNNKLVVFSINFPDDKNIDNFKNWYKGRWNGNENPLKVLVGEYNYNVNIGQGLEWIENPKQLKEKELAEKKLPILKEKKLELENKKPRKANTQKDKEYKLNKLSEDIDRKEEILSKEVEIISVRKTKGDQFISIFKAQIYNTLMSLLLMIGWKNVNPQEIKFVNRAIIRRSGNIIELENRLIIQLKPLNNKRDRLKQLKMINGINQQHIRTTNGKLIVLELLNKKGKTSKNSSP